MRAVKSHIFGLVYAMEKKFIKLNFKLQTNLKKKVTWYVMLTVVIGVRYAM